MHAVNRIKHAIDIKDRRTPFRDSLSLHLKVTPDWLASFTIANQSAFPLVAVIVILQLSPELRLVRVLLPERFIAHCYLLLRWRLHALPAQSSAQDKSWYYLVFNEHLVTYLSIS